MEERMKKNKKKKKFTKFAKFLWIYIAAFAVLMIITWVLLFSFIKDYEEGQPKHVMEALVEDFTADKLTSLLGDDIATSEFETKEQVIAYLEESASKGGISYRKKPGDYSESTPVFELLSDKKAIAKVSLASSGKNGHDFNIWEIGSVNISDYISGKDALVYTVTVPTGAKLTVNGVEVQDSYVKEADKEFSPCLYLKDYIKKVPSVTVYEIKGLLFTPDIKVSWNGTELARVPEEKEDSTNYEFSYPEDTAWIEEHKEEVITLAKNYSLYMIHQKDLATVTKGMVGKAADMVANIPAIWAYKDGGTASFSEMELSNCQKYSEDCYSLEVSYTLHVEWPASMNVNPVNYVTRLKYCYVKYGGSWRLAYFENM